MINFLCWREYCVTTFVGGWGYTMMPFVGGGGGSA